MLTVAKKKKEATAFGRRLREIREAAGLSQADLGERIGKVQQVIAKYESGANEPGWPIVLKLAEALECEPNDFRGEDDPPAASKRPRGPKK